MGEDIIDLAADQEVEALLRGELARENRAMLAIVPVLRHLLASEAQALLSDAILARVRGMILDCAAQLIAAIEGRDPAIRTASQTDPALLEHHADALMQDEALLGFCHALANESLLADRFQQRHGIDPVLTPLLQELIASDDAATASLAMRVLAAQSRFIQTQRRMELPLGELPAELFHAVVARGIDDGPPGIEQLQAGYDEATSRLGLLARLVAAMRRGSFAALSLDHAGLALFASALAAFNHQPRGQGVLACHEGQGVRLALALRAAELSLPAIERQFLLVEPAARMPRAIAAISSNRAAELLVAGPAA
jgi:hypothetical protein